MNKESLIALTRSTRIHILAATVTSLVGGAVGGYVIATKKLEGKYAAIAEDELNQARVYYRDLYSSLQKPTTPQEAVQTLMGEGELVSEAVEALRTYKGHPTLPLAEAWADVVSAVGEVEEHNVFDAADEDPDMPEDIMPDRDPDRPYIITADEYMEGELDYEQTTLSYFKEDGVLVDAREIPVENTDMVIGDDNLTKFGLGSRDKNVLYVRNEKIETDFELIQSSGSYTDEVLGLQHSDEPRVRRFRSYDD